MEYKRIKNKIFVRLSKGDEIFQSLYKLVELERINSAWINGIGAFERVTLGAYSVQKKDYKKTIFDGHYEIISLIGNLSINDNEPFLHIHVNMSDERCNSFGGHLFSGTITATCEIMMMLNDLNITRKMNKDIGLCLWDLNV